jgi:hypothetical protein
MCAAEVAVIATPMAEASKRGELTGIFIGWRNIVRSLPPEFEQRNIVQTILPIN